MSAALGSLAVNWCLRPCPPPACFLLLSPVGSQSHPIPRQPALLLGQNCPPPTLRTIPQFTFAAAAVAVPAVRTAFEHRGPSASYLSLRLCLFFNVGAAHLCIIVLPTPPCAVFSSSSPLCKTAPSLLHFLRLPQKSLSLRSVHPTLPSELFLFSSLLRLPVGPGTHHFRTVAIAYRVQKKPLLQSRLPRASPPCAASATRPKLRFRHRALCLSLAVR